MVSSISYTYDDVLLLEKLRKNNKEGFKRIFESYYPRLSFFVSRALRQDAASNRITLGCFVKLADIRSKLASLQDAAVFLYSCASVACMEFRSQNIFFDNRRTLMGYNLREKKRDLSLDILFAETSFAIYLCLCKDSRLYAGALDTNEAMLNRLTASDSDVNIELETASVVNMNSAPGIAMPEIMRISVFLKDLILSEVYDKKDSRLSPERLQALNAWLAQDIERRILLDEMKDPVNRSNAVLFFSAINTREGFEAIKRRISFASAFWLSIKRK